MTNANVTPIESKQPAPTGARFIIAASLDGFPVTVEVEGKADTLRAMIDRLKAIGAEPPAAAPSVGAAKPTGAPACPAHGTPMKPSRKPGGFFCPRRGDDGDFCPHKA
jgi:hypothetical protein